MAELISNVTGQLGFSLIKSIDLKAAEKEWWLLHELMLSSESNQIGVEA